MKHFTVASLGLRLQLVLSRFGLMNCIVAALCMAGLLAWGWWVPFVRGQLVQQQQSINEARKALSPHVKSAAIVALPLAEKRLAEFYNVLGEDAYREQQIKTVFGIAGKTGVHLNQAEYKVAVQKNGKFRTYEISLPLTGSYTQIREFCEKTLLAIPFASLDEMSFKRDNVSNTMLETKLRFTFYLSDEAPEQSAFSEGAIK